MEEASTESNTSVMTLSGSSGVALRRRAAKRDAQSEIKEKQKEIVFSGIECALRQLSEIKKLNENVDEFHTFGMYVASVLRSIGSKEYARQAKIRLNQLLLEIMANEPTVRRDNVFHTLYLIIMHFYITTGH